MRKKGTNTRDRKRNKKKYGPRMNGKNMLRVEKHLAERRQKELEEKANG